VIDGKHFATAAWPYDASWPLQKGRHRIEMISGDMRSELVEFEVW
jgi:hypothetical protein